MVTRPANFNRYEFVVLSALRAQQLLSGCVPRLPGEHMATTMAQMEVSAGHVSRGDDAAAPRQCIWQL